MWRFTAYPQTQKLVIKYKRRVTSCLIVRRRTCSPRWHTGRVPQTEVSERLVLHPFTIQKNTLCSTTRAPTTVDNRANTAHTAHFGHHKKRSQYRRHAVKQLNGDKRRVQCSSCCDLNASRIPELIKQLSTPQQKLPGETWLSTARPSLKHHTHCDQSTVGVLVKNVTAHSADASN